MEHRFRFGWRQSHRAAQHPNFEKLNAADNYRVKETRLKRLVYIHLFRTWTAGLTLAVFALCFFYRPEFLSWWMRTTTKFIEVGSGLLPYPFGYQIEVLSRHVGASAWFQITLAVLFLRLGMWLIGAGFRRLL
jgi:hypothetical protein